MLKALISLLGWERCAVCQQPRHPETMMTYITRRYDLKSGGHTDFELFYCGDNPSCAEVVTELPDFILDSEQ